MTIKEAIEKLGVDPYEIYSGIVLSKPLPAGVVPIRVGYPHPQENYIGVGHGSLYKNENKIPYAAVRLVVKYEQEMSLFLED